MSEDKSRVLYGTAVIAPKTDVIAGEYGTWILTYTVGHYGLDDGGRILITRRVISDWGIPQFDRPSEAEYTTVHTSGAAQLRAWFDRQAYVRPWRPGLVIQVCNGALAEGDTIIVKLGAAHAGGPGSRAQTFAEERFQFRVLVDPFGTGRYVLVPDPPTLRIVGDRATRLRLIAPSEAVVGERLSVLARVEDRWGNLSTSYRGAMSLSLQGETSVVAQHTFASADGGLHCFAGLSLSGSGTCRFVATDAANGLEAVSNPMLCREAAPTLHLFWGDLHGQSEETVGTGSAEAYFRYGRDASGLDFIGHQGNDFQITSEFWAELQRLVKAYYEPGHFVPFLGYEWSGNTPTGGDHNVYFLKDEGPLHRSSHWLVENDETDRHPLVALCETFRDRHDVLLIPHVGGRRANLDYHDPQLMPLIEIWSAHGYFDWFAEDALKRGLRVGFVAGSDDHSGRPGAAFPCAPEFQFGVRGGLTAVYATVLTREALWEALRARCCYGTSGERIVLWVELNGFPMGSEIETNEAASLFVRVTGTAALDEVAVLRGTRVAYRYPLPIPASQFAGRLRIAWKGAQVKDRGRQTDWSGELRLDRGRIVAAEGFALDTSLEGIAERSARRVTWRSYTSGDWDGVTLDLDVPEETQFAFSSQPYSFSFSLQDLVNGSLCIKAGGVSQEIIVTCLPTEPGPQQVEFTFVDDQIQSGLNPYWVRVTQADGEMAWSSPIFVTFKE